MSQLSDYRSGSQNFTYEGTCIDDRGRVEDDVLGEAIDRSVGGEEEEQEEHAEQCRGHARRKERIVRVLEQRENKKRSLPRRQAGFDGKHRDETKDKTHEAAGS